MNNVDSELVAPLPSEPSKPKRKSRVLLILLSVFSSGFLLVCGCCGFLLFEAIGDQERKVQAAIAEDETILAEIGAIESCRMSWSKSSAPERRGEKAYAIVGDKGSGTLYVESLGPWLTSIELEKEGQTWDLTIAPPDDPQFNKAIERFVAEDREITAKVGKVQSAKVDWRMTQRLEEIEGKGAPYVAVVTGTSGSADVVVEADIGTYEVYWVNLLENIPRLQPHFYPDASEFDSNEE